MLTSMARRSAENLALSRPKAHSITMAASVAPTTHVEIETTPPNVYARQYVLAVYTSEIRRRFKSDTL